MIRSALTKIVSLAMLCGLVAAAMAYPADKISLVLCISAYAVLLWFRPRLWLFIVPALLPILDFAPWTGWFFLDEFDILLLVTAAVGYWRSGTEKPSAGLPPFFAFALGLVTCVFAIGTYVGLMPLTTLSPNAFANYMSHYNSLRVAKGLVWAMIFLPLLRRSMGTNLCNIQRYFIPGMLLGFTGACLAVVWERATFPGLMNFSSDYRPTAPFSAMHTGGAALDAYLSIGFPFVAAWLFCVKSRLRVGLALLLMFLGCYAGLTTFSRDVYVAYACSGVVLMILAVAPRLRRGTLKKRRPLGIALVCAILAYVLAQVFATSGYRGLATSLSLLVASIVLGAAPYRIKSMATVTTGALVLAITDIGIFLYMQSTALTGIAKGPYLAFLLSVGVLAVGALLLLFGPAEKKPGGLAIAIAAYPGVALTTGLVAYHWGGDAALGRIGVLIAIGFALIAINRCRSQPIWHLNRPTLTLTFFCTIVFATAIPLSESYYLGARFSTVGDDFSTRMHHWQEALDMMDSDWQTEAFGMGLGRYPETYFWKNTHGEMPGTYSYEAENNNHFLRLGASQYARGFGETLRILQHVDLTPDTAYRLSLDVRQSLGNTELNASICERWLLYPQNCIGGPFRLLSAVGVWHHYEIPLLSGHLGEHSWLLRTPTQLEISIDGGRYVDVRNVSLLDPSASELIRNGSFAQANNYWFFSSDRNHFPWHIKNFIVNTFFELGWMGIVSLSLLILYVIGDLIVRALHEEQTAGVFLAALVGFLLVGLFDSLFDVPKLTLLFFLVIFVAVLRKTKKIEVRH